MILLNKKYFVHCEIDAKSLFTSALYDVLSRDNKLFIKTYCTRFVTFYWDKI